QRSTDVNENVLTTPGAPSLRPRSPNRHRRGTVMVYFAMLSFGLMALAAMVIDLGLAIVARRQMQTAADGAALEALRGRDARSDEQRREDAQHLVEQVFDDDLDPTDGDQYNLGAGPVLDFSGGIELGDPSFRASETFALSSTPVYKPSDSRWP